MINSWALLIVKAIDDKHVEKLYNWTPPPFLNIMIKTACKTSEKYKSYDNFKMVYNYDAEHDVVYTC